MSDFDDSRTFGLEDDDFDTLLEAMIEYGDTSVDVVNEIIHDSGDTIRNAIDPLIPVSGRTFKGHRSGAKGTKWQSYDKDEMLAITVGTISARRYLYFPDDGSNTIRHFGNQHFMLRGVEAAAPEILDRAVDALIKDFERR